MPQASDEQRQEWGGECGVGMDKAIDYLLSKGYTLTESFTWIKPSKAHIPTKREWGAILFLINEWDFAGIE